MSQVLSPHRRRRCPDRLLVELLALNEEMIEQLHLERLGHAGTADFLTRMIEQHEKAAALLRAQLAPLPLKRPHV